LLNKNYLTLNLKKILKMKNLLISTLLFLFSLTSFSQINNDSIQYSKQGSVNLKPKDVGIFTDEEAREIDMQIETYISLINKNIENIQTNLFDCHKQFRAGRITTLAGYSLMGYSLFVYGNVISTNNNPRVKGIKANNGKYIMIAGGVCSLIGSIIIIDSHKFIGRAGVGQVSLTWNVWDNKKK